MDESTRDSADPGSDTSAGGADNRDSAQEDTQGLHAGDGEERVGAVRFFWADDDCDDGCVVHLTAGQVVTACHLVDAIINNPDEDLIAVPVRWLRALKEIEKTYIRSEDLAEMVGWARDL